MGYKLYAAQAAPSRFALLSLRFGQFSITFFLFRFRHKKYTEVENLQVVESRTVSDRFGQFEFFAVVDG